MAKLTAVDPTTFGHRYPFHLFERSPGEPMYGALAALIQTVEQLVPLIRAADPDVDERLLEGLVVLKDPVDSRMLQPIA